jgi:hypothetical protein
MPNGVPFCTSVEARTAKGVSFRKTPFSSNEPVRARSMPSHAREARTRRGTSFAGEPHHREKPKIMGHNDFNDPLPGSRHE